MVSYGNNLYHYNGGWQLVGWVPLDFWNNYKVVITSKQLDIYINEELKYSLNGSFGAKSFLAFRDYGLCSGTVVNYLDNVRVTSCDDVDYNFTGKKLDRIPDWSISELGSMIRRLGGLSRRTRLRMG